MQKTSDTEYLEMTLLVKNTVEAFSKSLDYSTKLLSQGKAHGAISGLIQLTAVAAMAKELPHKLNSVLEVISATEDVEIPSMLQAISGEFTKAMEKLNADKDKFN